MINENKWLNTLRKNNIQEEQKLDHDRWINTISKKKENNPVKKYSFMLVIFICGLVFVSLVKNETRNLQKEISKLNVSINLTKFSLDQALLDNEVITSPENISLLAKEHLNTNLVFYNRSQIIKLGEETPKNNEIKANNFSKDLKLKVSKKIKQKKDELKKLKSIYSDPKSIPREIRMQVAKQIDKKKLELQSVFDEPKDKIFSDRATRWGAMQIVKAFLGIPVIPGR